MTEQEAIEFLFEILQRMLIYHEELTDDYCSRAERKEE